METTRLAPSPTGALHLGNARTFLVNWLLARQKGWRIILRIDDLDGPRIKQQADQAAMEDLAWLGIDWDQGPVYQSAHREIHHQAIERLVNGGWVYPCTCSRKDIELAASAPHATDGATIYPETCRPKNAQPVITAQPSALTPDWRINGGAALRFITQDQPLVVDDHFAAGQVYIPRRQLGDFVVRKNDLLPSYQLATVVDDQQMGITQVVRGDDLLDSTPRQILLYQALGWEKKIPQYYHLPLVVGTDGRRLAKRHGDTRLSSYRQSGVSAGRVLELLARWCGLRLDRPLGCAADLLEQFDLTKLPAEPMVFTESDEAWLRRGVW